jgi:hypothetical protein
VTAADCSSRPRLCANQEFGDPPAKVGFVVGVGDEQTSPRPRLSVGERQAAALIGVADRPGASVWVPKVTETVVSVVSPRPGGRC